MVLSGALCMSGLDPLGDLVSPNVGCIGIEAGRVTVRFGNAVGEAEATDAGQKSAGSNGATTFRQWRCR